jgi:acyl-CoA thioesterase YciA
MKSQSRCPATRVVMLPKDTNGMGNIFGGVILSHIDLAGAVAAREACSNRLVTVCMEQVIFKKPVHVNDVLTCWAKVTKIGKTSITTQVEVEVQRNGEVIPVTEATVVYVAVDEEGRPTPVQRYRKPRSNCKSGTCGTSKTPRKRGKSS